MLKNILSMVKEVIEKGNVQALQELNDIYEENEVEKLNLKIESASFFDIEDTGAAIVEISQISTNIAFPDEIYTYDGCGKYIRLDDVDEEVLSNIYNLEYCEKNDEGVINFLKRLNSFMDRVEELDIDIEYIHSPSEWNFEEEAVNIPNFVRIFQRICILPPEEWWTNNE